MNCYPSFSYLFTDDGEKKCIEYGYVVQRSGYEFSEN
jgi:hypothetical protein